MRTARRPVPATRRRILALVWIIGSSGLGSGCFRIDDSCSALSTCAPEGGDASPPGLLEPAVADATSDRMTEAGEASRPDAPDGLPPSADAEGGLQTGTESEPTRDGSVALDADKAGADVLNVDVGTIATDASEACSSACPSGASRCDVGGIETCTAQSSGCYAWSATSCPAGSLCIGDGGIASCAGCGHPMTITDPSPPSPDGGLLLDGFGTSVAVNAGTIVIGAPQAQGNIGAAYVFTASGTSWAFQAPLAPTDAVAGQLFGSQVAISGDIALVRSAPSGSPLVYAFARTGSAWFAQTKLAYAVGDYGSSFALDGTTAVLGNTNSVSIYVRTGAAWAQQATLVPNDYVPSNDFGGLVAISGDTVLVLAEPFDNAGLMTHVVYVFVRSGSTWTQQAKLVPNGLADTNDPHFTISLAVNGDTAVLAASPGAYVFNRLGTLWNAMPIIPSPTGDTDTFGNSVALTPTTLLVGGQTLPFQGPTGASYVFVPSSGQWRTATTLVTNLFQDDFGAGVALNGQTAVVGASLGASPVPMGSGPGIAYVYACAP